MRHLISYKVFESSRFIQFKEILNTIKDISQEFEDNNCQCELEPTDDIQLNIISLKSKGHLDSLKKIPLHLDINIDRRICHDEQRSGLSPFPEWFIDTCRRIEDYMSAEGFKTLPSIRYFSEWENLDVIDDLQNVIGFIQIVRLEFVPNY